MIKYNQKLKKYIGFINAALQNKNIDSEDHNWEKSDLLQNLIDSKTPFSLINSVKLGIESSELLLLIRIKENLPPTDNIISTIIKEITENIENHPQFDIINVIWILDSIDIKIKLRYICSTVINQIKNTLPNSPKFLSTYYVDKDISVHEIKLKNTKRPEMLLLPPLEPNVNIQETTDSEKKQYPDDLRGYMLTVNLYDIVEIYNQVGDILFKDNVRFGIGEQLGVDKAIKDTLKNDPNYFWFRNNGITMLVEEPDRILNCASGITLKPQGEEKINFSVINGAQTITVAAEYFYTLEAKIEASKHAKGSQETTLQSELKNAKNAKVILRIIQIQGTNIPEEARKISVALNRQKPIKIEDIAFTNYFVEKMNLYLDANGIGYSLAKRSEISYSPNEYSLIDFARARKACSGFPGEARNKDSATMLKVSDQESSQTMQRFTDTTIFVEEWYLSKDDKLDTEIFKKYYSPIPFAIKVANIYENNYKNMVTHDSYYDTIIKNGKWYFVAFLVFVLNGNDTDYSSFEFSSENITNEEIRSLIAEFANYYCHIFKKQTLKINSNTFKKSDLYKEMKNSGYEKSNFYLLLSRIFKLPYNLSAQSPSKSRTSPTKVTTVKLLFNNTTQNVNNAASAFSYTISECLKYAYEKNINLDSFIQDCSYISTSQQTSGYFKYTDSVTIDGKQFFIGKNHSFDTKVIHLNKLCKHLTIDPDSIYWMNGQDIVYKNS